MAKLQQKTLEEPVVELANKFDKYIYIDSSNGSDTTGDGSRSKPYATLDKIAESGVIENNYSYGIVLNNGDYELTEKVFNINYNKEINVIGNKDKTIVKVNGIYSNYSGGKGGYKFNFYRLIWDGNNYKGYNAIMPLPEMNLYNIVFKNIASNSYSYFDFIKTKLNINNSIISNKPDNMFRIEGGGIIQLTNCYGGFTSGYGTTDNMWNYQTNYITSVPKVDSTTYQITDDDNVWKNVGTGTNPDESQASLGVYGGEYSWEYNDDIF